MVEIASVAVRAEQQRRRIEHSPIEAPRQFLEGSLPAAMFNNSSGFFTRDPAGSRFRFIASTRRSAGRTYTAP